MDTQWLTMATGILGGIGWKVWAAGGAVLLALILMIALMRAERSFANVVLALVSLCALGLGAASAMMSPGLQLAGQGAAPASEAPAQAAEPAMACLDGLAGDKVEAACEPALFASPAMSAAALSYVAGQLSRLEAARGTPKAESTEIYVIRRTLEADRFGLVARVMASRDNCTPTQCASFELLGNSSNVVRNMQAGTYQALIDRHAAAWSGPALASAPATMPQVAPPAPSGSASSVEFPNAASIPPVSIMNAEPGAAKADADAEPQAKRTATPTPQARKPAAQQQAKRPAPDRPAPERRAAKPAAPPPIQIAPAPADAASDDN